MLKTDGFLYAVEINFGLC